MTQWIILKTPTALLMYLAALPLCLIDRRCHSSHGWLTLISGGLALGGTAVLLLEGGSLREAASLLTVFLLLNMGVKE